MKLLLAFLAVAAADMNYEALLTDLWTSTDRDGSGELSVAEFSAAMEKLGIEPSIFVDHNQDAAVLFADLDEDASGGMTQSELAGAVTRFPQYQDPLIAAFSNGATDVPTELPIPSPAMVAAKAFVTATLIVEGSPLAIPRGQRRQILAYFASLASVSTDAVSITFLPVDDHEGHDHDRRLQAGAETEISATIFVPTQAQADTASAAMPATAADFAAVPAFADLTVEDVEVEATPVSPPLPINTLAVLAILVVVVGVLLCCNACFWSSNNKRKKGQTGGCCSAGCCSFNAVKPWAFGELIGSVAIVGTVFFLYTEITGVANAIVGLVDVFIGLFDQASALPALGSVTSTVPTAIIDPLRANRNVFSLLPLFVMVPGILAAIFLAAGGVGASLRVRKGTYCCSKCFMFLAYFFLFDALVFYAVLAGVAVLFATAPPALMVSINTIRGMCVRMPAELSQRYADADAMVDRLSGAGQDVSEFTTMLGTVEDIRDLVDGGCTNLTLLLDELIGVFLPATFCVCAILFAFWLNTTLCCSAGCCRAPPKTDVVTTTSPADNKDKEVISV